MYAGDSLAARAGGAGPPSGSVVLCLDFEGVSRGEVCGGVYDRDLLVDVEADLGGVPGGSFVSPLPEPVGVERRLDLDDLSGGEELHCGTYGVDLQCEDEGGDVTPRSQCQPLLAEHEPPRGGYEFDCLPSVPASAGVQGSDSSDQEPADGLGGLYTWEWLDDAEVFLLGGELQ